MKCFLFFHKWEMARNTGIHQYFECWKCKNRKVVSAAIFRWSLQPIDMQWLETGIWWKPGTPPSPYGAILKQGVIPSNDCSDLPSDPKSE
jgi:hypothetical protein